MRFPAIVTAIAVLAISGCNQQPQATSDTAVQSKQAKEVAIDQSNLCEVKEWMHDPVARLCKPGQKVVFLPDRWGNEQLPVIFAAVNCDLRYNVVLTNGAVTCIYGPLTQNPASPAEPEKQKSPGTP